MSVQTYQSTDLLGSNKVLYLGRFVHIRKGSPIQNLLFLYLAIENLFRILSKLQRYNTVLFISLERFFLEGIAAFRERWSNIQGRTRKLPKHVVDLQKMLDEN